MVDSIQFGLLPYPMAASLHLYENEPSSQRRLSLLIHAFSQSVRFLGILLVADSLERLSFRRLSLILTTLARPTLGSWLSVTHALAPYSTDASAFLPEWPAALRRLNKSRYSNCVQGDLISSRVRMNALDALVTLRNVLSHDVAAPTVSEAERLLEDYDPILGGVTGHLAFMQGVDLYRLEDPTNRGTRILRLTGASEPFERRELPLADLPSREISEGTVWAVRGPRWLRLDPLMVLPYENDRRVDGEEIFLYNRVDGVRVHYVGAARTMSSKAERPRVMRALFSPETTFENSPLETRIIDASVDSLQGAIGSEYFPASYAERPSIESAVDSFINGPGANRVAALILTGTGGSGKTSLLCHTVSRLLADPTSSVIPLLVRGRALSNDAGSLKPNQLMAHLSAALGTPVRAPEDLIASLTGDLGGREHRLVLFVDAINEAPDLEALLFEIDLLVQAARKSSVLRIVCTVRTGHFELVLAQIRRSGRSWPETPRGYVCRSDGENVAVGLEVPRFSEREAKQAYSTYRGQNGFESAGCTTLYDELSDELRDLIRYPLLLRMLMETFDGRPVSPQVGPTELFRKFHTERLTPLQVASARKLAEKCLLLGRNVVSGEEASELDTSWDAARDRVGRMVLSAPIEQLLDLGLLVLRRDGGLGFAHQSYLEFLLAEHLRSTEMPDDELLSRVMALLAPGSSDIMVEEVAAYRLYLRDRLFDSGFDVAPIVAQLASERFRVLLAPTVKEVGPALRERLISVLRLTTDPLLVSSAAELFNIVGDREAEDRAYQRLLELPLDPLTRMTSEIRHLRLLRLKNDSYEALQYLAPLRRRVEALGDPGLLLQLDVEEGNLEFARGDARRARDVLSGGLERARIPELREQQRLALMCDLLRCKGCAEHDLEENRAGMGSHTESVSAAVELGDDVRLAMGLLNLADAQWACFNYGQSMLTYDRSIDVAIGTAYRDALDIALIGRGIVWWSVGRYEEAESSMSIGLDIAGELNYGWDLAYGKIYLSNLYSSRGDLELGLTCNREAVSLADSCGSFYLQGLSRAYLGWKLEVAGRYEETQDLGVDAWMRTCEERSIRGPGLLLRGVDTLRMCRQLSFTDDEFGNALGGFVGALRRMRLIKGPIEILCLQIAEAATVDRPRVDANAVRDFADEVIERKAESLLGEDLAGFLQSRAPL